jgi:hypothetical protein
MAARRARKHPFTPRFFPASSISMDAMASEQPEPRTLEISVAELILVSEDLWGIAQFVEEALGHRPASLGPPEGVGGCP